jgi:hypothetical protein
MNDAYINCEVLPGLLSAECFVLLDDSARCVE